MKLILTAAALLLATAADAQPRRESPAERIFRMPIISQPNAAGCPTPHQQIAQESRRNRNGEVHRLDLEPRGQLIAAVDRHVDGCHQLTFLRR